MAAYKFASDEFIEAVGAGTHKAFLETLQAGRPVFYFDADGLSKSNLPAAGREERPRAGSQSNVFRRGEQPVFQRRVSSSWDMLQLVMRA